MLTLRRIGLIGLVISTGAVTAISGWLCADVLGLRFRAASSEIGGLGAVSIGVSAALVEAVLVCGAAVALNFVLAGRVRQWGTQAIRWRRLHLRLTLLLFFLWAAAVAASAADLRWWPLSPAAYVLLLAVQHLFGIAAIILLLMPRATR